MTYAWFDATRNAGIARIMHISYRCKTYTWNDVIIVKGSMIRVFSPTVPPSGAGCSRVVTRVETPGGESWNV